MYFKNVWIKNNLKKIKTTPQEAATALEKYLIKEGVHNELLFYRLHPQYSQYSAVLKVVHPICEKTNRALTKVEIIGEREVDRMAKLAGIHPKS